MSRLQMILDELKNITTVDLAFKAGCFMEKLLWVTIGIIGTIWAFVFIGSQFKLWNESPWLTTRAHVHLSEVQYPAITFCSDGATKYAIAERLGNYIDPLKTMNLSQDLTHLKMSILEKILPVIKFTMSLQAGKKEYESVCRKGRHIGNENQCKTIELMYLYSQEVNISMKQVQEDLISFIVHDSGEEWNITNMFLQYVKKKTGHLNYNGDVPIYIKNKATDYGNTTSRNGRSIPQAPSPGVPPPPPPLPNDKKWGYIKSMLRIYGILMTRTEEFSLPMKNVGSMLVKLTLLYNRYSVAGTSSYQQKFINALDDLFTIPGQNLSLPDIAYLYSLIDFRAILEEREKYDGYIKFPGYPFQYPSIYGSSSLTEKSIFVNCFKRISDILSETIEGYDYFDDNFLQNTPIFPCSEPNTYLECIEYCNWHKNYFKTWPKEDFLTIMQYAMPQRKLFLEPILLNEKKLAKKLFGSDHIKNLDRIISPVSMAIFCHRKTTGFEGDDIGQPVKFCNDFFPTPTDKGICMTKYLNLKEILKINQQSDVVFETKSHPQSNTKSGNDIPWEDLTLVILPDSKKYFGQSYPRKPDSELNKIQFLLHDSKELAQMIFDGSFDEKYSADVITPIILEGGHEYYIKVTPMGSISTHGFRKIDIQHRHCRLENEVAPTSVFKVYTKNNCKYECHVKIAQDICKCIPWDFLHNFEAEECDVFGRLCFYNSISNLTKYPDNVCPHCIRGCDDIKYYKTSASSKLYEGYDGYQKFKHAYIKCVGNTCGNKCYGSTTFCNFMMDINNTLIDRGYKTLITEFSGKKFEKLRVELQKHLIIIHLKFGQPKMFLNDAKYTLLDKFANFGGNFGIFAEITGCSFLGLLNLFILAMKLLFSK